MYLNCCFFNTGFKNLLVFVAICYVLVEVNSRSFEDNGDSSGSNEERCNKTTTEPITDATTTVNPVVVQKDEKTTKAKSPVKGKTTPKKDKETKTKPTKATKPVKTTKQPARATKKTIEKLTKPTKAAVTKKPKTSTTTRA